VAGISGGVMRYLLAGVIAFVVAFAWIMLR
jgi:hypothetical protein